MGGGWTNEGEVAGEPVAPGDTRLTVDCECERIPGDILPIPETWRDE